MKIMKNLDTQEEFEQLIEDSRKKPQILLKHSTRCPISRGAMSECKRFAKRDNSADIWTLLVVENRELSQAVADQTGIEHRSPQAIIFRDGRPVWKGSHYDIIAEDLSAKIAE